MSGTERKRPARERGIVLVIALIALVSLSLAGLALMRAVSTGVLVAGNLGYKRATLMAAGHAVEAARQWLLLNATTLNNDNAAAGYWATWGNGVGGAVGTGSNPGQLDGSLPLNGAFAGWAPNAPVANAGWLSFSYVIHRMCDPALGSGVNANATSCIGVSSTGGSGSSMGGTASGRPQLALTTNNAFFRVSVAVQGPRNSTSFVQAMVR